MNFDWIQSSCWFSPTTSTRNAMLMEKGRLDFHPVMYLKGHYKCLIPTARLSGDTSNWSVAQVHLGTVGVYDHRFWTQFVEMRDSVLTHCDALLLPNDPCQMYFSLKLNREIPALCNWEHLSRLRFLDALNLCWSLFRCQFWRNMGSLLCGGP